MNKKAIFEINGHELYDDIVILKDMDKDLLLGSFISDDNRLYIAYLLETTRGESYEIKSTYAGTGTFKVPAPIISSKYAIKEVEPERLLRALFSQITIRELFCGFNKTLYEVGITDIEPYTDNIMSTLNFEDESAIKLNMILSKIINDTLDKYIPNYILCNYYSHISEKFNVEE